MAALIGRLLSPWIPRGGLELEQATNDLLKPKDCKKQVLRGGRLVSFGECRRAASGRALADTDFWIAPTAFRVDFLHTMRFPDESLDSSTKIDSRT